MASNVTSTGQAVDIEAVRRFWNQRPCDIRHSPAPVGTREYFDQVEARKYLVEPHSPLFAEFDRWQGKKVLEIGCGIGTDSVNFARHGARLTAVDLSDESLRVCQQRFQVYGLDGRLYQGNAEQLSSFVPVETYDLIYSFGVIHPTPPIRSGYSRKSRNTVAPKPRFG
jgi:2-polyprenyl-3-methyl-5-hydroxy-6-metoxy-1,4-benzoquinol methylase